MMIITLLKSHEQLVLSILVINLSSTYALPSPQIDEENLHGKPCHGSHECDANQWCYDNKCDLPCPRLHCERFKPPDGVCVVRDHQPVCKTPAELEFEERVPGNQTCRGSHECDWNQWCYDNKCDLPCAKLHCELIKPPDGVCVVRDHMPFCRTPAELERDEQLREVGGCTVNEDCQEREWCVYGACKDACHQLNCSAQQDDAECKVMYNHHPICVTNLIADNQVKEELAGAGESCTSSWDCEEELNCLDQKCADPCEGKWCEIFKLDKPPENYTKVQKDIFEWQKQYRWECVVWRHYAECVLQGFDVDNFDAEVEAKK